MSRPNRSIVVMGDRTPTTYLLVNHLAERFDVALVVFEHPPRSYFRRVIRARRRKVGTWKVAGQLLFLFIDRLWLRRRSEAQIEALLADWDTSPPDDRLRTIDVRSVNSSRVTKRLAKLRPACVVVSGTTILREKTLRHAPLWLNVHCGITPRYRGVHGGFWAVYEGRPDLAGVTVHRIDTGVDTGDIVAQATIPVERSDTYRTLPIKQYLAAIPLIETAVREALDGTIRFFQRDDLESRLWYSPTLIEYWRFRRRLRRIGC